MKIKRLGVRASVLDGEVVPGDVAIADGLIHAIGISPGGGTGIAVPGYIDLQVNGFAGVDFLVDDADGFIEAGRALATHGVTAYQPTLVSSPTETFVSALEQAAKAAGEPGVRILGVHLEGPFLAPQWKGAHDELYIVPPDVGLAARLCEAGPVTYMTIAPEQPGGFALLDWLVRRGITVSLGHTDADAATAHAAFDRGARAVTHLHNAQRRFAARDPGVAGVGLTRSDVTVQAIVDLVHLAPETVVIAWNAARGRFALVTDAISAADLADGDYSLGDRVVHVSQEAARLADGTLAGSVLSLDRAVRNLVALGVPEVEAVGAATVVPAKLIGRDDLGSLRVGTPADVTVLDDELFPLRTIVDGSELWAAG